jgi:tRNA(fMet)-specific endonuclease VapC
VSDPPGLTPSRGSLHAGPVADTASQPKCERVRQFLLRVDALPWDHDVTRTYGDLRAACEAKGVTLAPLDMMIAAHAVATDATLVTREKAFTHVPEPLRTDEWT